MSTLPPTGPPSGPPPARRPSGPPPAGPPPGPTGAFGAYGEPPPVGRPSQGRNLALVAVAILVVVGVVAAVLLAGGGDDEETAGGEIFLEPASAAGPDPFTDDVGSPPPSTPVATTVPPVVSGGAVQQISGGEPGLYGGTRDQRSCDIPKLQQFLAANPDKAAAWAGVLGVPNGIPAYLATLTPVLLRADTRVTNHGFANGRATPRQAVLQAGTAVLVDRQGVPRVKCACGNPLAPPRVVSKPRIRGQQWDGFNIEIVIVVAAAPEPLTELVVADISTGDPFVRPTGADAGPDRPVDDSTTTTTTAAPTTTTAPTTTVPPATDITGAGQVSASSEFSGEFPASLSVDGDVSSSWFSAGPEDGQTTYLWRGPGAVTIDAITLIGNASHSNPDFQTGFGFGTVEVRVVDDAGEILFSQEVGLGGTPDPDVTVNPNVTGTNVVLVFREHEASNCGGFAELRITGR